MPDSTPQLHINFSKSIFKVNSDINKEKKINKNNLSIGLNNNFLSTNNNRSLSNPNSSHNSNNISIDIHDNDSSKNKINCITKESKELRNNIQNKNYNREINPDLIISGQPNEKKISNKTLNNLIGKLI